MKISYSFYSLKNLSDLSKGERLIEILLSNGLSIDKADDHEPIRKEFVKSNLPEIWKGRGIDGGCSSCYFLFKGSKEIKFSGMVTWDINLHPNTKSFNGVHLWLNIPKNYDNSRLVQLGDNIFAWSEAVYGYITEESRDLANDFVGNAYDGLPGLMWVNYFGSPYIEESDFYMPAEHDITSHGARLILSEKPNDERLSDTNFLESVKDTIGNEWFWNPASKFKLKIPLFDRTAITRR